MDGMEMGSLKNQGHRGRASPKRGKSFCKAGQPPQQKVACGKCSFPWPQHELVGWLDATGAVCAAAWFSADAHIETAASGSGSRLLAKNTMIKVTVAFIPLALGSHYNGRRLAAP